MDTHTYTATFESGHTETTEAHCWADACRDAEGSAEDRNDWLVSLVRSDARAVNSHADLLAACEAQLALHDGTIAEFRERYGENGIEESVVALRAAIAKARA